VVPETDRPAAPCRYYFVVKDQTASTLPHQAAPDGEMEKLSTLALAAAKNFNDELTFILNHAEASLDLLGTAHPASPGLTELQQAAVRCAEITRCLQALTQRARVIHSATLQ
jgi:hypothetical protein